GMSADEAIGAELSMLFPQASRGSSMELIRHAMEGTQWDVVEIPIQHRSGQIRAVVWNSANIMGNDSKPIATIAQGQDITDRKWAEDALKESESKYRGLFENIQEAVVLRHVIYDERGEIIDLELVDANPAHLKILNAKSIEDVRGWKYSEIYSKNTVAWTLDHVRKVMTTGTSITEEYYLDLNDRFYILTTTPLGKNHALSTQVDITERKLVEAALKKSERSLNDAQHMAHIGSWEWNVQTGEINWSAELYSIYGVKPGKFTPSLRSFSDFIHPDDRRFVAEEIERISANGVAIRFDFRIVSFDGTIRILNTTGETIAFDKEGRPSLIVGTNQDITDRKRAEDEVRRSNAELQQFAYVASHDLQEPLRMVVNYLNLLERRYEDQLDAKGKEYIQFAVDGGKRMRALIDDLLMYSRVDTKSASFSKVDMNMVLDDTIKVLGVAIKSNNAEIIVHPLPTIMADRSNMSQIMQNVISNAIKFHGEERPKVEVSSSQTEMEYVFSIKDNGIGIDPKYYNKLFQMFQRLHTRDEYEGTGIGLAISKKIIDRHGGRIWFESDGRNGSTLFFTIPKIPRSGTDE
ncbi:MAG: PAS domain S-box protein, partial [Euryarchaeota archaeon]|nr:PAS domain S-box protein [Euryarchaeota archaeon]